MKTILNVVGARPNFMKIAPLTRALAAHPAVRQLLVHTGQHYDDNLSTVFFEELGIPRPDLNLGIGSGPREQQIEEITAAFGPVLDRERPDLLVVVGDVNSTIACARAARERRIPVAHVEAGLRSYDPDMPEEHNRVATDEISDLLFVTEPSGMTNLEREKVPGAAYLVGNVMIDTLVSQIEQARRSTVVARLGVTAPFCTATFHRPSNVDTPQRLDALLAVIEGVCARSRLVLPLHPRTRASLERHGRLERLAAIPDLLVTEPLGYLDFLALVMASRAVVTDSGGIQEETTYLGVPCLTMRENTERPVTIDVGTNVLVGTDRDLLLDELDRILAGESKQAGIPELWDGHAAERIAAIMVEFLDA